jgi:alpha-tubulin suppressor-like RCC1 family protein
MLFAQRLCKRFFSQKRLFLWGNSKYLKKKPMDMTKYIEGKVKKVGIGQNHMGIITECGKLYMMGTLHFYILSLL